MQDKIENILAYDVENQHLDYKVEEYKLGKDYKKHEILKDFCAMVNHPSEEDNYIIIGVKVKNGSVKEFFSVETTYDEANYQQYIAENIEPGINFEYQPFKYNGHSLMVFRLFNNKQRPYLIKRDIRNAKNSKRIEFRGGDGFIRKGTRNRKMKREDFELIYKKRYTQSDRKSDIIATPIIEPSRDELLIKYHLQCLDVNIENRSKKSIEFDDIELLIYKDDKIKLLSEFEARKFIRDYRDEESSFVGPGGFRMPTLNTDVPSFDINITEDDTHYSVRKVKLRMQKDLLTIAQESIKKSVFGNDIILFVNEITKIKGEIIIKSNDFSDGAFRKEFTFELK